MNTQVKKSFWLIGAAFLIVVAGCADDTVAESIQATTAAQAPVILDVYKSPSCGCCAKWIDHIDAAGFQAATHHPSDLNLVKQKLGVAPQYQSCHTGVSKEGYIFEGHVPAEIMQKFLAEKPKDALGLAVPGMPVGSPGMEMGDRYDDYDVLLLKKDGSSSVYARIQHQG